MCAAGTGRDVRGVRERRGRRRGRGGGRGQRALPPHVRAAERELHGALQGLPGQHKQLSIQY